MTALRVWLSRAMDVLFRGRREARLADEIESHLDLLAAEYVARGLEPEEARLAARRDFGGVEQLKDTHRDERGFPAINSIGQDVTLAFRSAWRDPGFTLGVVAVLALGIGVNNMLFTILYAHTLRGLPIPAPDRVLYMTTVTDRSPDAGLSLTEFKTWQAQARHFESIAAFASGSLVVSGDRRPAATLSATFVSPSAFALVGSRPYSGRDFTPQDDLDGAAPVAILSDSAWESRYSRDPGIIGRSIAVNGIPVTVVGIAADRSGFPSSPQIWAPLSLYRAVSARGDAPVRVLGRVRTGVDMSQARIEIETIASQQPVTSAQSGERRARVIPVNERYLGRYNDPAWLAFMAVGTIVVLISCANAANLMLERAMSRGREIAVRTALGASRFRIARQLCVEGAVLAALGGAAGLGVATAGVRLFQTGIPSDALPYWIDYSPDGRILAALVTVSAATVLLFALLPAVRGSRSDVNVVLKDGGRTQTGTAAGRRWGTIFLAAQFGLTVVLLAHFVANVRSVRPDQPSDVSLRSPTIVAASVTLPQASHATPERRAIFYGALLDRLGAQPAIQAVALTTHLPLHGGQPRRLDIAGDPPTDPQQPRMVTTLAISPDYFATFGLTVTRGRAFSASDGAPGQPAVIVNERFVERFFPGREPIGQRIAVSAADATVDPSFLTIVGVSPSIRQSGAAAADPVVYTPLRSVDPPASSLLVKSELATAALADLLRAEIEAIDPRVPLDRIRTMPQVVQDIEWVGRISRTLANVLTSVAVLVATLGLYAVTSYAVSQRSQEIGIRIALGAKSRQVVWFEARRIAKQLAIGLGTGWVLTRIWDAMFGTTRADVTASDAWPMLGVVAIVCVVAAIACYFPVRRATRLDPVAALRHE